jgi:glycosyltransferase involved in cell wall biosynthesis
MKADNQPLVSVIIPVYNTQKYLQDCIDSLLGQTLENIELVFVNDVSTDYSKDIILKNMRDHPNKIRLINLEQKGYLGGARNTGVKAAKAEVVAFCDSDDYMHPEMLEKMYLKMQHASSDMVITNAFSAPEGLSYYEALKANLQIYLPLNYELLRWDGVDLPDSGVDDLIVYQRDFWSCMIKKDILLDNAIEWPRARYEDNFAYSLLTAYISKVAFVNEGLYFYRQRSGSISNKKNESYQIRDRREIENALLRELKKRGLFEQHFAAWEYNYIFRYAINTSYLALTHFDNAPYNEIREIVKDLEGHFPLWRRNKYWKKEKSTKEKVLSLMMLYTPRFAHKLITLRSYS